MVRRSALLLLMSCAGLAGCQRAPEPDPERLQSRVVQQVEFGPRVPGTSAHDRQVEWMRAELARLGGAVEVQEFTDSTLGRPLPVRNVIARFGPSGGRRILFCAHYDSRPFADLDPDPARRDQPIAGANDGGSGVAVLLELAEMMHVRPPAVGVDLVFFDAEDLGRADQPHEFCIGSRGYAARLPAKGDPARPVAGFLFDMVGDRDLDIHVEGNSQRRAANLVALVLEAARRTGATDFHPDVRYTVTDDHVSLLDAGLPCVVLIDFDYPAWHTLADTPEQTSGASLAQVTRVGAWLLYQSPLSRP